MRRYQHAMAAVNVVKHRADTNDGLDIICKCAVWVTCSRRLKTVYLDGLEYQTS